MILIVVAAVALAACDSSEDLSPSTASAAKPDRPCSKTKARRDMKAFVSSVNQGDAKQMQVTIAQKSAFRVFSVGFEYGSGFPKKFFTSKQRKPVIRKLLHRYTLGDRYRLESLRMTGYDRPFDICNAVFTIDRRIAGGPWKLFIGKGATDTPTGAVSVWNVGGETDR